jgi:hypothetical protein
MKVYFSILPGQNNHQVGTLLNHSGQFLESRIRNRFPLPISLKQPDGVRQGEWYKIPLEDIQNLYESIPRMIAAVLKTKGGPTPY